jgi:DNA-binding NtrC family response regulator
VKQSILVIDDEPQMLGLIERILREEASLEVLTESNSLEVPGILENRNFDLIITDLRMPGLDGMDILRLVKAKERFEEVVIITAFGSLETASEALALDVYDYITKPFKREQLTGTVSRALRCQRMKREALTLMEVVEKEPFTAAREAFRMEYIRRLAARSGGDLAVMAERSGLSEQEISASGRGGGKDEE